MEPQKKLRVNSDGSSVQRRVQQFNKSVEPLGVRGKRILELLGAGNKPSDVAKTVGCRKSNITYWIKKLLRMEAIRLQCHDVYDTYSLTAWGSTLLTRSEEGREVVLLEDFAVKFGVVECEKVLLDWVRLGEPRNWVKLGVRVDGVRVVKNGDRSLVVHPGRLRGFDVDELLFQSGQVVERVKLVLEGRFGMVLSGEGVPLHKPIFRYYSEEARELVKYGTTIVEGVGSIDCSPPERVPHEEYVGRHLARDRLLLPLRVQGLESKVDSLINEVHALVTALNGLLTSPSGQAVEREPSYRV